MMDFFKRSKTAIILTIVAIVFITLCVLVARAQAADFTLTWDPVAGVTGYKIYQSIDNGTTWTLTQGALTATTHRVTGAPDDKMILYRVSALNGVIESVSNWKGAWFDARLKPPPTPQAAGASD